MHQKGGAVPAWVGVSLLILLLLALHPGGRRAAPCLPLDALRLWRVSDLHRVHALEAERVLDQPRAQPRVSPLPEVDAFRFRLSRRSVPGLPEPSLVRHAAPPGTGGG